jgi:hypothetical protein
VLLFVIVAWEVLPLWDGICEEISIGEWLFVSFERVGSGKVFERIVCGRILFVLFVIAARVVFCFGNAMWWGFGGGRCLFADFNRVENGKFFERFV